MCRSVLFVKLVQQYTYKTFKNMVMSKIIRLHMHIVKEQIKQCCWRQSVTNGVYDVMLK